MRTGQEFVWPCCTIAVVFLESGDPPADAAIDERHLAHGLRYARGVREFSFSAVVAGFVAVLVGYTSSAVIVFEAARAAGATPAQTASWMWALGLGMGLTTIVLSLRYRMPVLTAWSTPGAALLITGVGGLPMAEIVGAFVLTGLAIVAIGLSGAFDRLMKQLPAALAAAMLAGVLLRFGLDAFGAMKSQFALVFAMFATYLVGRRVWPRFAVPVAFAVGASIAGALGLFAAARVADGAHAAGVRCAGTVMGGRHRCRVATARRHDGFTECARCGDASGARIHATGVADHHDDGCGNNTAGAFRRLHIQPRGHHRSDLHGT